MAYSILPWLICYSFLTSAQVTENPTNFLVNQQTSKQFYLAGPLYDGVNTVGCFWPQLLSGLRNDAIWVDLGLLFTPSAGLGYRYLFKPAQFDHLCFGGVYGYLEWPNYYVNPYSVSLYKMVGAPGKISNLFWDAVEYSRWNVGFEVSTPDLQLTLNGYGFISQENPLKDDLNIQQEKNGLSLRLSYLATGLKPFIVASRSYVKETSKQSKPQNECTWLITVALGVRYQLTDKINFELKGIKDSGKQYHLPVHFGFHYTPGAPSYRAHALPAGYTTLPERFITHYQNADLRQKAYYTVFYPE